MRRSKLSICLAVALTLPAMAAAQTVEPIRQFLIELHGGGPHGLSAGVAAAGGRLTWLDEEFGYGSAVSDDPAFAATLERMGGVKRVTRDLRLQWTPTVEESGLALAESVSLSGGGHDPTTAAWYACQWNLAQIDAGGAWTGGHLGDPAVQVAVLDSGVDPLHPDLAGVIDTARSASTLTPGSSACAGEEPLFQDFNFHGSFVASQIATNNLAIAGAAPWATIVGVKVLDCLGTGSFGDVIAGILYAAGLADVEVINLSLGAYLPKDLPGAGPLVAALNKAVTFAGSQGKLVVSSTGGNAADLDHDGNFIHVPSMSGSSVSVYATDIQEGLATYSNHGVSGTWVGAPGGDFPNPAPALPGCALDPALQSLVLGVCPTTSLTIPACGAGTSYLLAAGTSFAAPLAAGVAALVDGKYLGALNGGQLKSILKNTADDLGAVGADNLFSHGRVNAAAAVAE